MTAIRAMTEDEFFTWRAAAIPHYAGEKVAAGQWSHTESLELATQAHDELLPHGLGTRDNHFYVIVDETASSQVGTLWFAEKARSGSRIAYVYDVRVSPEHQRRGHASRAFRALEHEVRGLDLSGIALHVFGHNIAARALYAKLGFEPTNINLFKRVSGDNL
jgi:ribosomal protein S18 acetylase RimI-like enzyme